MQIKASKVLIICKSQLGVKESPRYSNAVKYNTWFYNRKVAGSAFAWCATFLDWCFEQAGGGSLFPRNANAAYAQDEIVSKCGGKWIMQKNRSRQARASMLYKIKPGDIVTFDFGAFDGYRRHIGIVKERKGVYLHCYEGNTSSYGSQSNGGQVMLKKRHFTDICAVARPAYAKETVKKPQTVRKVYINPGHSDTDPGAVSKWGKERDFNIKGARAMHKYLKKNYVVKVYRNKGSFKDLKKICKSANEKGVDLFVSIHFNAGKGDGWEGCLYSLSEKRKKLGSIFEKHIKRIGQNSRGLKARPDLSVLKNTDMPAILNEMAFIDNYKDIKDWNDDEELEKMGGALAKAVAEYLNLTKKENGNGGK